MTKRVIGDKASLSEIRRQVRAELNRVSADPSLSFDCLVALTEACTNALVHGQSDRESRPPEVGWDIDPTTAVFVVADYCPQQWKSKAVHPSRRTTTVELDERSGGFGLELMSALMDEVEISNGRDGTTVTLRKRLS